MLKKDITFTDFLGRTQTQPFYFHLKEDEIAKKDITATGGGGYEGAIRRMQATSDMESIYKEFEFVVLGAVGYISEDGFSFVKDESYVKRFRESNAYSELVMELLSDQDGRNPADKLAEFVNAIMPAKFAEEKAKRDAAQAQTGVPEGVRQPQDYRPDARQLAEQARQAQAATPAPIPVEYPPVTQAPPVQSLPPQYQPAPHPDPYPQP